MHVCTSHSEACTDIQLLFYTENMYVCI